MNNKLQNLKALLLGVITILVSALTLILGAPLMRLLRKAYGPIFYWGLGFIGVVTLSLVGLQLVALTVGALWLTLGLFIELEIRGVGWWEAGVASILAGFISLAGAGWLLAKYNIGITFESLQVIAQTVADRAKEVNPSLSIDAKLLAVQVPSLLLIILIIAVGLALVFEKKAYAVFQIQRQRMASQIKLLDMRIPDFYIWIVLFSALFALVDFKISFQKEIAINILNVSVVLYFFQGIAVLEVFMRALRVGNLMKVVFYMLIVGQLLVLFSAIGFVDYWINFRLRIRKKILKSSGIK